MFGNMKFVVDDLFAPFPQVFADRSYLGAVEPSQVLRQQLCAAELISLSPDGVLPTDALRKTEGHWH
jgi:hypothetical protein